MLAFLSLAVAFQTIPESFGQALFRSSQAVDASAIGQHVCGGHEVEWGTCEAQPKCEDCYPVDCQFSAWSDWWPGGHCTGLRFRHRGFAVANNKCGMPCYGEKIMSEPWVDEACISAVRDCIFSPWSEWTQCLDEMDQSVRSRNIDQAPARGGTACKGSTSETRPCGGPRAEPCVFDDWHDWTDCSATCGEGRHTRMRRVHSEDKLNGQTCDDALLETGPCKLYPCQSRDCILGQWSGWSHCGLSSQQRMRHRMVVQSPEGEGHECNATLVETTGCSSNRAEDCRISAWTLWSKCDATCHGGQKFRERSVIHPSIHGGSCRLQRLKEVTPCSTQPCSEAAIDCAFSIWGDWSRCSARQGWGLRTRSRRISTPASGKGLDCDGSIQEVKPCMLAPARVINCTWGEWGGWSGCSATCGVGSKRRNRAIAMAPQHHGLACQPHHKEIIEACHMDRCDDECEDGRWAPWNDWSECSATCSGAYRSRRRDVDVLPNACGSMPDGNREQFQVCSKLQPCQQDADCLLSQWGEWSHCSCSCDGVRERNRFISAYAKGDGKACDHLSLKTIQPCNPIPGFEPPDACQKRPPQDCLLSAWGQWGRCTSTCGGGQQTRKRGVVRQSVHGGKPCGGVMSITRGCNPQPCSVIAAKDCKWGYWSDWGACTHCGGQRWRHRSVAQMPNAKGKLCQATDAKQVSNCTSECSKPYFCSWGDWSPLHCMMACGQTSSVRNRGMQLLPTAEDYIFKGTKHSSCFGTQILLAKCPFHKSCRDSCQPKDCFFGPWGDWNEPSCVGLCERQRVIAATNNECGRPCRGSLLETKRCHTSCGHAVDCRMSQWSPWSHCTNLTSADLRGQKYRSRHVLDKPLNGGNACSGDLRQTRACDTEMPEPCIFSPWKAWNPCSVTCGEGTQTRNRHILRTAEDGGRQCHGASEEIQACHAWHHLGCMADAMRNCRFGGWGEWGQCGFSMQRERKRQVMQAAQAGGLPCHGPLKETATCHHDPGDCQMTDWTSWDSCSKTCGSGQQRRQRQINRFPVHGGRICPKDMVQIRGCHFKACHVHDCQVSGWLEWGQCSVSCGSGHQSRSRAILSLRGPGGYGCSFPLSEFRACGDKHCAVDCSWNAWSEWGGCSKTCGGGFTKRTRAILSMPSQGGVTCDDRDMEELRPCNVGECATTCINGLWSNWATWSRCSASCAGGEMFRRREVARMANSCGLPAVGVDKETKFCNVNVPCHASQPCLFTSWSDWNLCSASCNGLAMRKREVAQFGAGDGLFCMGSLKEITPCNPRPHEDPPVLCVAGPPVDCITSDWNSWSACPATCGGGQRERSRHIIQYPQNGGFGCEQSLSELQECARPSCHHAQPVDCVYGEWKEWGTCGSCNGERYRYREILIYPANGGQRCAPADIGQVGSCPHNCDMETTCMWTDWGSWGSCSITCGTGGERKRVRRLDSFVWPADTNTDSFRSKSLQTMQGYDALYQRAQALDNDHTQDVILAFSAGCLSLVVVGAFARVAGSAWAAMTPQPVVYEYSAVDGYASDDADVRGLLRS